MKLMMCVPLWHMLTRYMNSKNKPLKIHQRLNVRMVCFFVAMPMLLGLLVQCVPLQRFDHEKYPLQAENKHLNAIPVLPVRGEIFDVQGKGLAINQIDYRIYMIPDRVENLDITLSHLQQELHWSDDKMHLIHQKIQLARSDRSVLLDVSHLAVHLQDYPGIDVKTGNYRQYPFAELTSHLIGYISMAHKEDVEKGYLPSEFVGRSGVERSFESSLHGQLGDQRKETDVHARRISMVNHQVPAIGKTIRLALDVEVQQAASDALGDRTGAVVVMDVHTGAVITLLSKPGFDTNKFIAGLELVQWREWLNNPEKPLLNHAIEAAYPSPQIFKLYKLADQLGLDASSNTPLAWGLGEKTGIDLPSESRGNVPIQSPHMIAAIKDSQSRRNKQLHGETLVKGVGESTLTVTPLQVARLAAAIANGGYVLKPQLLAGHKPEILHQAHVSKQALHTIRSAMRDVVRSPAGKAHRSLGSAKWSVVGKTGALQVVKMLSSKKNKLMAQDIEYRLKDQTWFMGYAPYKNPQIAIAVFVEHGRHGDSAAASVAAAVINVLAGREH